MLIIKTEANENGSRPPIQNFGADFVPDGFSVFPDDPSLITDYVTFNGFVDLVIDKDNVVTDMSPNIEAWEAWRASLPEPAPETPAPTFEERLAALESKNDGVEATLDAVLTGLEALYE